MRSPEESVPPTGAPPAGDLSSGPADALPPATAGDPRPGAADGTDPVAAAGEESAATAATSADAHAPARPAPPVPAPSGAHPTGGPDATAGPYPPAQWAAPPAGAHPGPPPGGFPPPYPPPPGPQSPPQAARRQHRWGFGAYVLAEVVFLGSSALIGVLAGGRAGIGTVLLALTVPTVLAATTAIVATRIRGNGPRLDLGLQWSWRDVGIGAAFGVGGLVLTVPAALVYARIVGTEEATSAVGEVFEGLRTGPLLAWTAFAAVVLLGPLCEEIVYRGLLWGAMEKHGARLWLAFVLTTLVFALAHFEFARTPLLFVVAIPIGLARLLTRRLTASVVAHAINNLLPGLALALGLLGALPQVG